MSGTRKKFNIHSRGTQDRLFCFILLLPAIILCITFIIIPIIDSVWMSFTDYKIANLTQGIMENGIILQIIPDCGILENFSQRQVLRFSLFL